MKSPYKETSAYYVFVSFESVNFDNLKENKKINNLIKSFFYGAPNARFLFPVFEQFYEDLQVSSCHLSRL